MPVTKNKKRSKRQITARRQAQRRFFAVRLVHRQHSFRLLPHHHTSYPLLGLMLILVGIFSFGWTSYAAGEGYNVTATVPAPSLTAPAVIAAVKDGDVVQNSLLTVTGGCPANSYVKLFQNQIFAGAALCQENGQWNIQIHLAQGKNLLRAQAYNVTDQPGPASPELTVTYNPPGLTADSSDAPPPAVNPLILSGEFRYFGVFAGQPFQQTITISGGTGPYALSVDWGDGSNGLYSQLEPGNVAMDHVYAYPGDYKNSYVVKVTATDSNRQVSSLQTVAIIAPSTGTGVSTTGLTQEGGQGGSSTAGTAVGSYKQFWAMVLPTYVVSLVALSSFWLGQHRELEVLRRQVGSQRRRSAH